MQSRDEFIGETLTSVETLVAKSKKKEDQNGEVAEQLDNEEDNSVDLDESTMPVLLPRTPGKRKAAAMMATQGMFRNLKHSGNCRTAHMKCKVIYLRDTGHLIMYNFLDLSCSDYDEDDAEDDNVNAEDIDGDGDGGCIPQGPQEYQTVEGVDRCQGRCNGTSIPTKWYIHIQILPQPWHLTLNM